MSVPYVLIFLLSLCAPQEEPGRVSRCCHLMAMGFLGQVTYPLSLRFLLRKIGIDLGLLCHLFSHS